jgi:hypothetical protein
MVANQPALSALNFEAARKAQNEALATVHHVFDRLAAVNQNVMPIEDVLMDKDRILQEVYPALNEIWRTYRRLVEETKVHPVILVLNPQTGATYESVTAEDLRGLSEKYKAENKPFPPVLDKMLRQIYGHS